MYMFHLFGLDAFYGAILATITGYIFSFVYSLSKLRIEFNFNYKDIVSTLKEVLLPSSLMLLALLVLNIFIKLPTSGIIKIVLTLVIYTLIGAVVYIGVSFKTGLLERTFGKEYINKILGKLRRIK